MNGLPARKVAICGTAPSSIGLAPFADQEWEIWGTSRLWQQVPRYDLWFELHELATIGKGWTCDEATRKQNREVHLNWLAGQPRPVYLQTEDERVPAGIKYPLDEVLSYMAREFGSTERYLTNHISYMIALAIYERVSEIGIYGVDMALDEEYCVAPDTRVLTSDLRWVTAGSLSVDDQLLGFDEHSGPNADGPGAFRRWRVADVEAAPTITRPCYRVYFEDGTEVVCSHEHKWLCHVLNQNVWRETRDLVTSAHREGRPTRVVKAVDVWDEDRQWDAGYLAAAFDGEGCLNQTPIKECTTHGLNLSFSQRENAMAATVEEALDRREFEYSKTPKDSVFNHTVLGGRPEIMRLLGSIRPRRLMDGFNPDVLGTFRRKEAVAVTRIEDIGEQQVIALQTSTRTFVAEGFASHNCYQRPSVEYLVGLARASGIKVHIPAEADLLKAIHLYGYDDNHPSGFLIRSRKQELQDRLAGAKSDRLQLQFQRAEMLGAASLADELSEKPDEEVPASTREGLKQHAEQWRAAVQGLEQRIGQHSADIQGFNGAIDNMKYIQRAWM